MGNSILGFVCQELRDLSTGEERQHIEYQWIAQLNISKTEVFE